MITVYHMSANRDDDRAEAQYQSERDRLLCFLTEARRVENAAYAVWERPSVTPAQRNQQRRDYLRAADEVDALITAIVRLDKRHAQRRALARQQRQRAQGEATPCAD